MNGVIITIVLAIIVIVVLHIIARRINITEYMNNISDNIMVKGASLYVTAVLFGAFIIFGVFNLFTDKGTRIFGYLLLFNFLIALTLSKFILALYYKKTKRSIKSLKSKKEYEEIQERKKSGINAGNKKSSKIEKEMDDNYLNDDEKKLVNKGDYEPVNFEYPEDHENLDEDDFYSEDDR